MSGIDPRQLAAMLRADAQKMGISVEELIKRIMGGGQSVVGHLGAGTIPQGPTFISAEGGGVWNNIEPEQHEPMDDFEELAQVHSQLLEENDGNELARDVALRDHLVGKQAALAPFSNMNPRSAAAGGANIGSTQSVQSGGPLATVVNWQGDSSETTDVSVTLFMQPPPTNFGAFDVKPFARLNWGCNGIVAQADVDIGQGGVQLTLGASSLTVQVGVDPAVAPVNPCTLILSGMMSFRPIMRTAPVTRTVYVDGAALVNTGGLGIPAFAKKVWLFRSNLAEVITMNFQNSGLTTLYQFVLAANANMTDAIPLSNDCTLITLTGGGGLSRARLIFELGI